MNQQHDLIVIGAGSGGVAAARRAASHGARVLIAENSRVGGTCVIRGCVPKKLMMYAAGLSGAFAEAAAYGWELAQPRFHLERWQDAKAREIDRLEGIYLGLLAQAGVTLVRGRARLLSPGVVDIDGQTHQAPRVLVATGGAPVRDSLPGIDAAMTSTELLDLRQRPDSLLVVGGGYIACEFASILAGMGSQVSLVYRDTLPLRGFDAGLREQLAQALAARGITLLAGVAPTRLDHGPAGFTLHRADGSTVRAQAALNATGRRPNTAGLGLEACGVRLSARGAVLVDEDSRSTAPGIWAVGDVTDRVNLTPVAIAEGRAFADTEFGGRPTRVDHHNIASAVFTDPPVGTVGQTEQDAAARGPVEIYEAAFRPMRTAFAGGSTRSWMKLVVDSATQRVLGIHMLGADAPEIVQSLAVAITCGATKRDFDRTVAVHPTAAEEFMLMREPVRRVG